ncbi:cell adhesion molecule 2-like [Macrobrachium rosenbergii]|uniref:cell adhesion molecule 2-like n=1 Tax=Macrobrachium rosenbergii TaxID=79674 RepID=UPI0034D4C2A2
MAHARPSTTTSTATSTATATTPAVFSWPTACLLQRHLLLILLSCSLFSYNGLALKWVRFNVPSLAVFGGEVLMTCEFDLEGDQLYSVKWYKANREFYRYVPAEKPSIQYFPTPGINVVSERSNQHQVTLSEVNLNTTGRYKCEVLAEAPHFRTLAKSNSLKVYALPDGNPEVVGGQHQYRPGDFVNLTCKAPKSIPATTLQWFINDQQVPQDYLRQYHSPADSEGRVSSQLGLQFTAQASHFDQGRVVMKCAADLHPLYNENVQHESIVVAPDPLSLGHDASGSESAPKQSKLWYLLILLVLCSCSFSVSSLTSPY